MRGARLFFLDDDSGELSSVVDQEEFFNEYGIELIVYQINIPGKYDALYAEKMENFLIGNQVQRRFGSSPCLYTAPRKEDSESDDEELAKIFEELGDLATAASLDSLIGWLES